ncbi:universal stress protein [Kribbella sp. NPDC049174]|uniref:universal stress protein n=1 Tax=Kribbella sp. NPDC049174 TaxID=3364112 RepID=UPI003714F51A
MTTKPIIHVGVDGSWRDNGALEWALQESQLRHEPLQALHVIDDKLRGSSYWQPTVVDDAVMELVKDVQKHLDSSPGSLDHEVGLIAGPPAATLTEASAEGRMLVVGRRGLGAFKRLLIGSTSEAVASAATVPVVVVPDHWQPSDHTGPVFVAVEDAGDDQGALDFAVTAAAERNLPIRLVHAWDLPAMYSWDAVNMAGVSEELPAKARHRVDALADRLRSKYPGLTIDVDVRRGHPVDSVVTAAEDSDAQLLVVGGRRHHRLSAVLLGSVARGILHHATCPMAVVHARRDHTGDGGTR